MADLIERTYTKADILKMSAKKLAIEYNLPQSAIEFTMRKHFLRQTQIRVNGHAADLVFPDKTGPKKKGTPRELLGHPAAKEILIDLVRQDMKKDQGAR